MTTDKRNTSKTAASPKTGPGSQPGKVKGQGQVTPKADATEPKRAVKSEERKDLDLAYQDGRRASETGAVPRPNPGYTADEVKAWRQGYKDHANPNARGQVEGIESGYRKDY